MEGDVFQNLKEKSKLRLNQEMKCGPNPVLCTSNIVFRVFIRLLIKYTYFKSQVMILL